MNQDNYSGSITPCNSVPSNIEDLLSTDFFMNEEPNSVLSIPRRISSSISMDEYISLHNNQSNNAPRTRRSHNLTSEERVEHLNDYLRNTLRIEENQHRHQQQRIRLQPRCQVRRLERQRTQSQQTPQSNRVRTRTNNHRLRRAFTPDREIMNPICDSCSITYNTDNVQPMRMENESGKEHTNSDETVVQYQLQQHERTRFEEELEALRNNVYGSLQALSYEELVQRQCNRRAELEAYTQRVIRTMQTKATGEESSTENNNAMDDGI